jgi:lipoprotein-releasing system ATP-binding protein
MAAAGIKVRDVSKGFGTETRRVEVLRDLSFDLTAGQALAITGPSGSGKSTLLHLIGTLEPPDSGTIEIDGRRPHELPERELARFRNKSVGFVFQDHHLLPQYSVQENVLLPTLAFERTAERQQERALELLDRVELSHRLTHRPAELSGGERQRVAVARALINAPGLLLCDEPTGSLDPKTALSVTDLLLELHREQGVTLIVVTHSRELAERIERSMELREGRCIER